MADYAPPGEPRSSAPAGATGTVLAAWLASGAAIGLALGLTAQLTGLERGVANPIGIATLLSMGVAGVVAIRIERGLAQARPAVRNARGELERPLHPGLYAIPLCLALPALAMLVVVGSVATASLVPAVVFGMGGFTLGWGARRLVSSHGLTSALEALEAGELEEARSRLQRVESGWLSTRSGRVSARLNLGMLALSEGRLEVAERYYASIRTGAGATFAKAGLALVHVLQDRLDEAETTLLAALSSPGATHLQGQLDAVRLLLVMRQEDDPTARHMGEQLLDLEAGELFRGLLALLRLRTGDADGARELADDATRAALEESGWPSVIPEIAELVATPT